MWAGTDSLEVVLLVGGTSAAEQAAATAHVVAVDPASDGVPMIQLRKLQLDARLGEVAVYFGGNSTVRVLQAFVSKLMPGAYQ